ncbi:MAG TPA: sigma-70 family RNA polymerase sigma factor [Cyclobacteriaceae bacterium]|nr:sigma-70 family RNA polymerase sigma factor [Cyclobacteriaceae bacterium]
MKYPELIPHLFRTEHSRITAVLCKLFGTAHIETAEDIVSETFMQALETWPYKGVPENPAAWLYSVAKNKARNYIVRQHIFSDKVANEVKINSSPVHEMDIDLSEKNITDSRLQMLFAICYPSIPEEAQIGLALRILCGFGIDEIANAFLSNRETITKRLMRAREKLRTEKVEIAFPGNAEINQRLDTVLRTLYLLFNEGYYSETEDSVLREDLCLEAMRLTYMLIENEKTNRPDVNALLALMCFHASRFAARKNGSGEIILYDDQDESLWSQELIAKGVFHLNAASTGSKLSKYHLEANIAYWHTVKTDSKEKWENILMFFNLLLQIEYSPIAALNRTYALSKVHGKEEAIKQAEKLKLTNNHYYFMLLGHLYTGIDRQKAISNFQKALDLATTSSDKATISKNLLNNFRDHQ